MKQVWETKDGRKLKIKDMATSHIKHCINILERAHNYASSSPICDIDDGMINGMVDSYFVAEGYIEAFKTELEKRKDVEKLWV